MYFRFAKLSPFPWNFTSVCITARGNLMMVFEKCDNVWRDVWFKYKIIDQAFSSCTIERNLDSISERILIISCRTSVSPSVTREIKSWRTYKFVAIRRRRALLGCFWRRKRRGVIWLHERLLPLAVDPAANARSPFVSWADKIVTGVNFREEEASSRTTHARSAVWRDLHLGNLLTRFNRGPSSQTLWLVLDDVGVLFNPCTKSRTNFANYIYNVVSQYARDQDGLKNCSGSRPRENRLCAPSRHFRDLGTKLP